MGSVLLPAASAQAEIEWKPCGDSNEVACGHLTVPLDPSGATPGTITLTMRRHRSPVGEAKDAVIALAGGPGQAAIPFTGEFVQLLGPIVSTRDLIVFDQRGTGLSHPLSCAAFEHLKAELTPAAVGICAGQIGATRGLYTTADTVADIEAIRRAGGYEKLVLYGTSYGTKVAERYAQEYPSHVEALVLDSVVPPNGPEAFDKTTFEAVGRVLRQLCSARACAHITPEPVRDLARLVKRASRGPLLGRVVNGRGEAEPMRIASSELIGALIAGDLDPLLRAEFPAAVRSAASGDTAALARLLARAEGAGEEEESLSEGFDTPLYYSTICDETAFPWNGAAGLRTRLGEAKRALEAQPRSVFAPFTANDALALSDIPACVGWPPTPEEPQAGLPPLPNVPTLILSGADDLRTPTANARAVAAQIPDAHLLVVPNTGHSVLGSDPTSCAHDALQALFANRPIEPCKQTKPPALLLPTPVSPRNLGLVAPAPGNRGPAGRTLDAAVLTLGDFERQVLLAVLERGAATNPLSRLPTVRVGGLRSGWGGTVRTGLLLHDYSYIPGVTVSGRISSQGATMRIGGSTALHGTIAIGRRGTLSGVLGGQHVRLAVPKSSSLGVNGASLALRSRSSALLTGAARTATPRVGGTALPLGSGTAALLRYALIVRS
jgi:pimeloyl-ACP methyl ester carboxylesterase